MARCKDCRTEIKIRKIDQTQAKYATEKLLKKFPICECGNCRESLM